MNVNEKLGARISINHMQSNVVDERRSRRLWSLCLLKIGIARKPQLYFRSQIILSFSQVIGEYHA